MHTNRKYSIKTNTNKKTLDIQHNTNMSVIQKKNNEIEKKQLELDKLTEKIEAMNALKTKRDLTDDEYDTLMKWTDDSIDLRRDITRLRESFDEVSYFTDTADVLFQYYNLVENCGDGDDDKQHQQPKSTSSNTPSILSFFGAKEKVPQQQEDTSKGGGGPPPQQTQPKSSKTALMDKYLSCTDNNYIRNTQTETIEKCYNCGSANITLVPNDGYVLCHDCNCIEHIVVDHEKPSYREPPKEICYYSYKRINHLNELTRYLLVIATTLVNGIILSHLQHLQIAGTPLEVIRSQVQNIGFSDFRTGSETRWRWVRALCS
jgi:hypothetical protein